MRPLYHLGQDLLALADLLDACEGGEIPPELDAYFAALQDEQAAKLDNVLAFIAEKDMRAAAAKAEADQWQERARRERRAAEMVRQRLHLFLVATGQPKAVTAAGKTVSVQANGGAVPLVIDPAEPHGNHPLYAVAKTLWAWDTDAIRADLAAGKDLPFARQGERGTHLRIR